MIVSHLKHKLATVYVMYAVCIQNLCLNLHYPKRSRQDGVCEVYFVTGIFCKNMPGMSEQQKCTRMFKCCIDSCIVTELKFVLLLKECGFF